MTLEGKTVKSITFNWHQDSNGDGAGEDYYTIMVGKNGVKSITYHEPLGTGDAHYCDIEHEDGSITRQFNINSIDFVQESAKCDYCMNLKLSDNKINTTVYGKIFESYGNDEFSIGKQQEDGKYILHCENEDGISGDTIIKYCPHCGRKLI